MKDEGRRDSSVQLKITGDGSHTLFVPALNEHYHSVFGAIGESRHIFIDAGLKFAIKANDRIRILEIGFGTGLNAFLTLIEARRSGFMVDYTAIDTHPLEKDIYSVLNYPDLIDAPGSSEGFFKLHRAKWEHTAEINPCFNLLKIKSGLSEYNPGEGVFDLVYFDAFGPDVQPAMWTAAMFEKVASALVSGGIVMTYSTKGTVKRNMKAAGLHLQKLPGPAGKREILRAVKIQVI